MGQFSTLMKKTLLIVFFFYVVYLHGQSVGLLSGQVTDSLSSRPLESVNIIVEGTKAGASTDVTGHFNLALAAGQYVLIFRMVGFESLKRTIRIKPGSSMHETYFLRPQAFTMPPLIVTDNEIKGSVLDIDLSRELIAKFPSLGENDVFHAVKILPAVATAHDYGNQLYIRGSRFDQTLVTFNGVTIYNPYHLGGLFGAFDADAVQKVEFAPDGDFSKQSSRLSGRLNIVPKDGSDGKTKISLGLLSSKFHSGDTLKNASWFLSGRRTYIDFISQRDGTPGYGFYDMSANVNYKINRSHALSLFSFYSRDFLQDVFDPEELLPKGNRGPLWGNRITGLRWKWAYNKNIYFNTSLGYSGAGVLVRANQVDVDNTIDEYLVKSTVLWSVPGHLFQAGLEVKNMRYNYRWDIGQPVSLEDMVGTPQFIFFDNAPSKFKYQKKSVRASIFVQDAIDFGERYGLTGGVRLSRDNLSKKTYLLPRVQISYKYSKSLSFSATAAKHIQYDYTLKEIKNEFFFAPFSIYFPTDKVRQPLQSLNLSFGADYNSNSLGHINSEIYLKKIRNVPSVNTFSGELEIQKSSAYGFELLYRNNFKAFSVLASYAFSRSTVITEKQTYLSSFDRSNALKLFVAYDLGHDWQISAFQSYLSGLPYAPLIGRFVGAGSTDRDIHISPINDPAGFIGPDGPVDLGRNSKRFPAYLRLDFGLQKNWRWGGTVFSMKLQAINISNRRNPAFIDFNLDISNEGPKTKNNLPFIPSIEFSLQF